MCPSSCRMYDIAPSWDEETVALLLGAQNSIRVDFIHRDDNAKSDGGANVNAKTAKLSFGSQDEMRNIVMAYQGLAIPMTQGFHYYSFSAVDGSDGGDDHPTDTVSVTPPLHLQLMALPTKELERRLNLLGSDVT